MTSLRRGLIAGAAGTIALDLVTYADMALRGRPTSEVPGRLVEATLGINDDHRREAVGALAGIATGLGVGVVMSVARQHGVRLSPVGGSVVTGALAMAASDLPVALADVSDPREWSGADWVSDVVPHLAYGAATHLVLRSQDEAPAARPSAGLVARSFVLGVASGGRSTLGLVGAAVSSGGPRARTLAGVALAGELVADKLPMAPSRTEPAGFASRIGTAAVGATAFAATEQATVDLPVAAGVAGAWVGTTLGSAWRAWAPSRMPAWQAAVVEDVVAVSLALLVSRRS